MWNALCRNIGSLAAPTRLLILLKVMALLLIVGFVMAGHPPSNAQSSSRLDRGQEVSAEDVRQDTDISYIKSEQVTQSAAYTAIQVIVVKQGEDLARLDTKITMLFTFLGLLQVGGLLLSVFPLKRTSLRDMKEGE